MTSAASSDNASNAAAVVAKTAPLVRPWAKPTPDSDGLAAARISVKTWMEATCDRKLGSLIRCEFTWFGEQGRLTESVETPKVSVWRDPLNPDEKLEVEPEVAQAPSSAGKKKRGKADAPPPEPTPAKSPPPEEPLVPVLRRYEKMSPELLATCDFVRRLADLSLTIRVRYPGPQPAPSPEAVEQNAEATGPPELSQEVIIPLAPLLVRSRNGQPPEIVEDICATVGCEGLSGFRIGVACDGPVLSEAVGRHLNPLLITVEGVHKLPHEEHRGQTRDRVSVVLNAFGERRAAKPKSLDSRGGAKFRFHNVFFVGTWNWRELRDFLQSERMAIEVHDRGMPSSVAMLSGADSAVKKDQGALESPTPKAAARGGGKKPTAAEPLAPRPELETDEKSFDTEAGPTSEHFGAATFSLADVANLRRVIPLSMRVDIEPVGVGSGATGNIPGKAHRNTSANGEATAELADEGSTELDGSAKQDESIKLDEPITLDEPTKLDESTRRLATCTLHEHAPGYVECNSYVSLSVELARPLHPRPIEYNVSAPTPSGADAEAEGAVQPPVPQPAKPAAEKQKPPTPQKKAPPGKPTSADQQKAIETAQSERLEIDEVEQEPARYECFQRIVIILQYRMSSKVKSLLHLVKETNADAVCTDEVEEGGAEEGELTENRKLNPWLDILTGFIFLDRKHRVIVIEGLRDGVAWPKVLDIAGVGRDKNSRKCKVLYHPDVGFNQRLYGEFSLDLKQIKLKASTLDRLLRRPALYNVNHSDQTAVAALMSLAEIKRVDRLHHLKASTGFPSANGLSAVEEHYGASVTDAELEGGCEERSSSVEAEFRSQPSLRSVSRSTYASTIRSTLTRAVTQQQIESEDSESSFDDIPVPRQRRPTMKEALNCDNTNFRKSLLARSSLVPASIIDRNKAMISSRSDAISAINPHGKKVPDQSFLEGVPVHIYSGQKLHTADLQKRAIRQRMESNEVLLTYSQDKNSGCFPLLDYEVSLENVLRAPDPNYKDARPPFQYPKPREVEEYRKLDRWVDEQRKADLQEVWDEGVLSTKLECRNSKPVHNVFDAKSLGTGGAHVIGLRRPGLRDAEGAPPPPKTRHEQELERGPLCPRIQKEEMKIPHFNNMGTENTVDKYHKGLLESAPAVKGICFSKRRVDKTIAEKYGRGLQATKNLEPMPVSLQLDEDFSEEPRTSTHPFRLSQLCAKQVAVKEPLSARDSSRQRRTTLLKYTRHPVSGTLAGWQKAVSNGAHLTFQKPAFVPQAVTPLPLSAR